MFKMSVFTVTHVAGCTQHRFVDCFTMHIIRDHLMLCSAIFVRLHVHLVEFLENCRDSLAVLNEITFGLFVSCESITELPAMLI